jgi:hypothetical protein
MKVKELIEILQKQNPNREIMLLNDSKIYTIDSDHKVIMFSQKHLDKIVVMHLKKLQ